LACIFFFRFKQSDITIRLGEYDFDKEGETSPSDYKLASMTMHEDYDPKSFDNDIAVLTLDRTVPFSKTVYPICLPPKGESFTNKRAFVIGKMLCRIIANKQSL
jgi:hypothetical protein